jgi:transcriptional regulator with XRE-family HTH domain
MSWSKSRSPSPVDDFVGARIRERRMDLGLTSHQFGEKIGLTYQQVNHYERGRDRVSAGRLYEIACALNTPIDFFYEGFDRENPRRASARQGRRKQVEMARLLDAIHDEKHLEAISQVTRALARR